uniref:Transmembrane protein 188 n=1 Tax=Echinococcus granulosus TaxID=6210 RepID=U6JIE6_ECHGR|nr:transmembrane protein 188 [Echinococcus granulosus]CDS21547.1 transmembrane protein 188 [Echinococcus granulosus]
MIQFYNTQLLASSAPPAAEPTEDLKAFERRLREIVDGLRPRAKLWRIILLAATVFWLSATYLWLTDPLTYQVNFITSLGKHPCFAVSTCLMIGLFLVGAHKKVVLPSIIAQRCRTVLAEYNMTCDNSGKLILLPRPN